MRLITVLILVIATGPAPAWADYILGATEVNNSLKTLSRFVKESQDGKTARARADALAKLAKEANYLASLINLEIRSHGFEQKPLIDLAVGRCEDLGVSIRYDSGKERYFYDQRAYAEYLRVAPSGPHRREAKFLVLERMFYAQKSTDRAGIADLTREIEQFLSRYPKDPRRVELELFLVVLHRDMYRLTSGEPGAGIVEKDKVKKLCAALIARYPGTAEAKVAEAILNGLE